MSAQLDVRADVAPPVQADAVCRFEWREYLLSRRRALKLEIQEIEKLLELKPRKP